MRSLVPARLKKIDAKGFSLVEVLLVVVAVGILVALMGSIPNSVGLITKSKHQSLAREIILKQIEDKRAISYTNLTDTDPLGDTFNSSTDSRLALLSSGLGRITILACDPLICPNGEEVKEITVEVTWTESGKPQIVKMKSFIAKGGLNQ